MKSKPYGVRFEMELLDLMREKLNIKTPQKVLNYLSDKWILENIQEAKDAPILKPKDVVIEDKPEIKVPPKVNVIRIAEIAEPQKVFKEPFFIEDIPEEEEEDEEKKVYKAHDDAYYMEEMDNCTELKDVKRLWDMICNDPEMSIPRKRSWEAELQRSGLKSTNFQPCTNANRKHECSI